MHNHRLKDTHAPRNITYKTKIDNKKERKKDKKKSPAKDYAATFGNLEKIIPFLLKKELNY